ncbi:MAG TPA: hypothetical protein DIW20_00365 [Rhodospirillaceae bacterium]|nr:hypothetical protein [Rhodospirillaceae bacterium]
MAVSETAMRLTPDDGRPAVVWAFADIVILDKYDTSHPARLSMRHSPDARLLIESAAAWKAIHPYLQSAQDHSPRLAASWGTLALYAVLAVLIVVLAVHYVPRYSANLAALVPNSAARALGERVITTHFDNPVCVDEKGRAAFAKMLARIGSGIEKPLEYTPLVLRDDMTNAVAAPGDYVVVLKGLIHDVKSPEEMAGVVAHELGHVYYNHPLRGMMRYMGLSFMMGMMVGDSSVLDAAGTLSALSFGREDEAAADDFAVAALTRAGVDSRKFAEFFERHGGKGADEKDEKEQKGQPKGAQGAEKVMEYFSPHPASSSRAVKIRAEGRAAPAGSAPLLTAQEWQSLKNICDKTVPLKQWLDEQEGRHP